MGFELRICGPTGQRFAPCAETELDALLEGSYRVPKISL